MGALPGGRPVTVVEVVSAAAGEHTDLSRQAPLARPFYEGLPVTAGWSLQAQQASPPVQVVYKHTQDRRGIRADEDQQWRPDGAALSFRAAAAEVPGPTAGRSTAEVLGLVPGEAPYRWNAAEHNRQRWRATAVEPTAEAVEHLSISTFNAGGYRGHVEKFRCGSFHILLGQEVGGATPELREARLAEIRHEGFVPVVESDQLIGCLAHLYGGHDVLWSHADEYFEALLVRLRLQTALCGLRELTVGSFHINNVHAKKSYVSHGILHTVLSRACEAEASILGYDVNRATGGVLRVLEEFGRGGLIAQTPPQQDCVGLVLPPGSPLLQLRLDPPKYFSFYRGDLQLSLRDTDAHYLVAAHFHVGNKRTRTGKARQHRQQRKKASRRAKNTAATEQQEDQGVGPDEDLEGRTEKAPSSESDSEDLASPYLRRPPPRPSAESLAWAAEMRRRRQRRGADRPRADPGCTRPPPPWEPEDAGANDVGWQPWFLWPPTAFYDQPVVGPGRRAPDEGLLDCLPEG